MRKFGKGSANGFAASLSRAVRQGLDPLHGGHGSSRNRGFAHNLTQSIANDIVAPGNNRPGREFTRRGWGNNLAGLVTQELSNDLVRSSRPKGKRGR